MREEMIIMTGGEPPTSRISSVGSFHTPAFCATCAASSTVSATSGRIAASYSARVRWMTAVPHSIPLTCRSISLMLLKVSLALRA